MLKLFDTIAQHNSPADKIKLLKGYPYQGELKEILRYATDPFITFGITSMVRPLSWVANDGQAQQILDLLAARKLTGQEARVRLGACMESEEDFLLYTRVLNKDLRCGVGEKLVLQVYPGLIRQFDVMRAAKFDKLNPRDSVIIEPKYDGLRCIAMVDKGAVTLLSRNGNEFTSSDHLKPQLLSLIGKHGDGVFDGELTSGNFNESASAVKRKNDPNPETVYNIFDFLTTDEWKNPITPWRQRRYQLEDMFQEPTGDRLILTPAFSATTEEEIFRYYHYFLSRGYEGAIVKNSRGLYRFKRHKDWRKLKEANDVDLPVLSLVQGEGKYRGMLGAAIVNFRGKRVSVGSGFSDDQRAQFWENPNLIMHKTIEIRYHQVTPDGSLRHPRFIQVRVDK